MTIALITLTLILAVTYIRMRIYKRAWTITKGRLEDVMQANEILRNQQASLLRVVRDEVEWPEEIG